MPSIGPTLSPRTEPLAISSQSRRRPALNSRQPTNLGAPTPHLRLPSLPRFHPANFASSQNSSAVATPLTGPNSPHSPSSPRHLTTSSRQYEAQRQMFLYQQQLLAHTTRTHRGSAKPDSPRLEPMASPGAVTPLELEGHEYLTAGVNPSEASKQVESLIRQEARRAGEYSPGRVTPVGGR